MSAVWPPAERPSEESAADRERVVLAAARGDVSTVARATGHPDDRVRASALTGLHRLGALTEDHIAEALRDRSTRVRRTLAQLAATSSAVPLGELVVDPEPAVVETACWAAGERPGSDSGIVAQLVDVAAGHTDALCREAAVAALGAIGDPAGLPAILAATSDKATVRRRAVLALAPFDTPEVSAALQRALADRDWQVRQAAEDLLDVQ